MTINVPRIIVGFMTLALGIMLSSPFAGAESLNPEGINPHADAPRKRITQEQRLAAAKAMKKRQAEIEARKAARKASAAPQNQAPASSESNSESGSR